LSANPSITVQPGLIFEERWFNKLLMKTFQINIFAILLTASFITCCKKNAAINEKQAILFQVDYVNYALGYQHNGFIITNQGNVLTYQNPQNWNFPDKDLKLSESQVRDNIGNCLNSGKKISIEELKKYANYIKNISSSKVTALKNIAADAGSTEYICYQYSEKSGTYKGGLLKMEGDFTCENLNFFTKKVITWLKNINDTIEKK
jgi:hypothetical protein